MPDYAIIFLVVACPILATLAVALVLIGIGKEMTARDPDPMAKVARKHVSKPVSEPELIDFSGGCSGGEPSQGEPLAKPSKHVSEPLAKPSKHVSLVHAEALLGWLEEYYRQHGHYPKGTPVNAGDVKTWAYPKLLAEQGWEARPWDGRHGVAKHLTALTDGKRYAYFEGEHGKKTYGRAYVIYPLGRPTAVAARVEGKKIARPADADRARVRLGAARAPRSPTASEPCRGVASASAYPSPSAPPWRASANGHLR
jgi:hypothetical protein